MPIINNPTYYRTNSASAQLGAMIFFHGGMDESNVIRDNLFFKREYDDNNGLIDFSNQIDQTVVPLINHSMVEYNKKLYIYGGYGLNNGNTSSDLFYYDLIDSTGQTYVNSTVSNRRDHIALVYQNNMIIFGGSVGSGTILNSIDYFNFIDQTQIYSDYTTLDFRDLAAGVVDTNTGKFYLIGGVSNFNSGTVLNSIEVFDWKTKTSKYLSNMPIELSGHTAELINNSIFVIGGSDQNYNFNSNVYKYDISTDTQSIIDSSADMRGSGVSQNQDGTFIIYGGTTEVDGSNYVSISKLKGFQVRESGKEPRCQRILDAYSNVLVNAGQAEQHGAFIGNLYYVLSNAGIQCYDFDVNSWAPNVISMMHDTTTAYTVESDGNFIYKIGGLDHTAGNFFQGDFTNILNWGLNLPDPRYNHQSTIYNGLIYIQGGAGGSTAHKSDQMIYNTIAQDFSFITGLDNTLAIQDRSNGNIVPFNDKLYVFSGCDSSGNDISQLDIYDISSNAWSIGEPMLVGMPRKHAIAGEGDGIIYMYGGNKIDGTNRNEHNPSIVTIDYGLSAYDVSNNLQYQSMSGTPESDMNYFYPGAGRINPSGAIKDGAMYIWGGNFFDYYSNFPYTFQIQRMSEEPTVQRYTSGIKVSTKDMTLSNETYRYSVQGGAFTPVTTTNTPLSRFGAAIGKIGDNVFMHGGATDISVLQIDSIPMFKNKYVVNVVQDFSSYSHQYYWQDAIAINHIEQQNPTTGFGLETQFTGHSFPYDFGTDNTVGADGQYVLIGPSNNEYTIIGVSVVYEGGGVGELIVCSYDGTRADTSPLASINQSVSPISVSLPVNVSQAVIYVKLPAGTIIKNVQMYLKMQLM